MSASLARLVGIALGLAIASASLPALDAPTVMIGVVAALLAGALASRVIRGVTDGRHGGGNLPARAHRRGLRGMPAPQHPRTAGRPSPRAPDGCAAAA